MAQPVTLRQLERRLARFARSISLSVTRLMGTVGRSVGREVVLATPVLTGFARGNWRPSLNVPAVVPISTLDPSGVATIARIGNVFARFRPGDTGYITNNASYIDALNNGSSPQAEAGFVEAATLRGFEKALGSLQSGIFVDQYGRRRDLATGRFAKRGT